LVFCFIGVRRCVKYVIQNVNPANVIGFDEVHELTSDDVHGIDFFWDTLWGKIKLAIARSAIWLNGL